MRVLADASALVKLLVDEEGHEHAVSIWEAADSVLASRLAYPEIRSALARAERRGRLGAGGHRNAKRVLEEIWDRVDVVELSDPVARGAAEVAEAFGLRAGDAVHLSSALLLADDDLLLATWDRDLGRAARRAGLAVVPPSSDPRPRRA